MPFLSLPNETILGALLVIGGVVAKNSEEQLKRAPTLFGPAMFALGWLLVAHAISRNKANKGKGAVKLATPFLASALIFGSVMAMKAAMKKKPAGTKGRVPMFLPLLFVAGWLLLAFSISQNRLIAFGAAALVFAAMLFFLPKQREKNVVDGPGMVLFTLAWVGIVYANVVQAKSAPKR